MEAIDIIVAILGGILTSLASTFVWETVKKPRMIMKTVPKGSDEPAIQTNTNWRRAFYHLKVINKGKTTAYDCGVEIIFRDSDEKQLFKLSGKWDKGPQPLIPIAIHTKKGVVIRDYPYPSLIYASELTNVRPDIPETFCLIMKYDGEDECYAFSSWSYVKGVGLKVNEWKLGIGEYYAVVKIKAGNVSKKATFQIENKGKNMLDVEISKRDC